MKALAVSGIVALVLTACSSLPEPDVRDPEALYRAAQQAFERKETVLAQRWLETIRLQHPASQYADDALFLLAQLHYQQQQYVMAAFFYQQLRESYPQSPYAREALYRIGLSYLQLSPPYDRDQEYTHKAIQAFAEFRALYPEDTLAQDAARQIAQLRAKLAQRDYSIAQLYEKLESPESALIYYNAVLSEYADTPYAEPALVGKIRLLAQLRRTTEALRAIEQYRQSFPQGGYRGAVESIAANLTHDMRSGQ